ncbi:MAG: hypothetical protein UT66_C0026G0004 [candidate division CPR2 bacterium GW2011_GWC1_39_9]|uniref:Uncharacterized protein n=1 Tax=candidate division CPR2 bacterium GW2011_GWC2_39_10 TaxID=1618345 RepID=A0A0G0PA51_UNCC2|nr:MAG: hypothetical protein UT18_C0005G0034 [candidate division CPR2 bacterium GW2011_GWC2_39_10]KKR34252.1 MAG: hypothetical protein UT66_C0026G0004 [candidate division CPR2 bacterium GW2011_GWC1_39_9]
MSKKLDPQKEIKEIADSFKKNYKEYLILATIYMVIIFGNMYFFESLLNAALADVVMEGNLSIFHVVGIMLALGLFQAIIYYGVYFNYFAKDKKPRDPNMLTLVIILGFIVSYITVVKILNFDPTLHSFSFFGTLIGLALANKYRLNGFGKKKAAKE